MSGRPVISKPSIIEAAIALIREGGWAGVSARGIAARLGSSTMPIYSAIGSMDDLRKLVGEEVARRLDRAQRTPRTGNESLDLAVGYVVFARDEPRLFRFLLDGRENMDRTIVGAVGEPCFARSIGPADPFQDVVRRFGASGEFDDFVLRTWIFASGLAELLAGGQVKMDEADIIRHVSAAGQAFLLMAKGKK